MTQSLMLPGLSIVNPAKSDRWVSTVDPHSLLVKAVCCLFFSLDLNLLGSYTCGSRVFPNVQKAKLMGMELGVEKPGKGSERGKGIHCFAGQTSIFIAKISFPLEVSPFSLYFFFNQDLMYIYSVYLKLNFIYLFLNFGCAGSLLWHSSFSSCFTWA